MNTTTELTDEQILQTAKQKFMDFGSGSIEMSQEEFLQVVRALLQHTAAPVQPSLDFSKPLETVGGDPVKHVCADVIEYKSARVCVDQATGVVYSSPYHGLKIRNAAAAQSVQPKEAGNLAITMLTHLGFLGVVLSKEQIAGIERICNWLASQAAPSVPEGVIQAIEQVIEWINGLPVPTTGATAKMMLLDKVVKQLAAAPAAQAPVQSDEQYLIMGYGETDTPEFKIAPTKEAAFEMVIGMMFDPPSEMPDNERAAWKNSFDDPDEWIMDGARWDTTFEIGGIEVTKIPRAAMQENGNTGSEE